ncbi:MAG: proline dehydrogenase family protein [Acidobacteria bacterium]|nr:proline dehydrogenase family protein [Acidobacteriota bacterium]
MLDALSRRLFLALAGSRTLKDVASRHGMRSRRGAARRFIGGRNVNEAIDAARQLERRGLLHTFNYLGEHVRSREAAEAATIAYLWVIESVSLAGMSCNLSVKLTQLGLELDTGLCRNNLKRILTHSDARRCFVRVDMEGSPLVDRTLDVVAAMRTDGYRHLGVVLQSALRRTPDDLARVTELGLPVRLVKGAYKEPANVAYPDKRDVDRAFVQLAETLLDAGSHPAFASHDPRMIRAVRAAADVRGLGPDRFEFQMLYGVRRDLQAALQARGYAVRIYVPFGGDWFPYFMRRLAERPANVLFVARSLLHEQIGNQRGYDP